MISPGSHMIKSKQSCDLKGFIQFVQEHRRSSGLVNWTAKLVSNFESRYQVHSSFLFFFFFSCAVAFHKGFLSPLLVGSMPIWDTTLTPHLPLFPGIQASHWCAGVPQSLCGVQPALLWVAAPWAPAFTSCPSMGGSHLLDSPASKDTGWKMKDAEGERRQQRALLCFSWKFHISIPDMWDSQGWREGALSMKVCLGHQFHSLPPSEQHYVRMARLIFLAFVFT